MAPIKILSPLLLSSLAVFTHGEVTQKDFSGVGHIFVLNSSEWQSASPELKVGCLDNDGRFINEESMDDCGTFARLDDYPYTLSSTEGNCTFSDENTVPNSDSYYGKKDHAWTCNATYEAVVYDEFYTINGFSYPFLCWGDIACFYDAKRIPEQGEKESLWQYRWGSHQRGITPGHIQLQLLWNKTGELPKREDLDTVPGPRVELKPEMQKPIFRGQQGLS